MLLLSASFVGLASTLLVFLIKRYKLVRTACISIYLFIFFGTIGSHYYQFYGTNEQILGFTYFTSRILFFLLGPILYFYIRVLLNQQEINFKKDWVHFIPLGSCLVCLSPFIDASDSDKVLLLLTPIHLLSYLIICLYKIIKDDAENPGIVHSSATVNTLIYLFLLFQCYVAIMYSLGSFSLFYFSHLSPRLTTNFAQESFNGTKHGVTALIILVLITTVLVYITDTKSNKQNNISSNSLLR